MDFDTLLKLGAPIGAAIVFLVGLYQWADARRRDIEQKRFEQFHRAFEWVAGRTASGQLLVDVQQAMAIRELANFPEYRRISIPIIDYYLERSTGEPDRGLLRSALLDAKEQLAASKI